MSTLKLKKNYELSSVSQGSDFYKNNCLRWTAIPEKINVLESKWVNFPAGFLKKASFKLRYSLSQK